MYEIYSIILTSLVETNVSNLRCLFLVNLCRYTTVRQSV